MFLWLLFLEEGRLDLSLEGGWWGWKCVVVGFVGGEGVGEVGVLYEFLFDVLLVDVSLGFLRGSTHVWFSFSN